MNNEKTIEKIIEKIKKNKISTTEIADCLGKKGSIEDVGALNRGHFRVGKVTLVYGYNERNWEIHEQLQNIPENNIVVVETHNCKKRAVFGELVSKYIVLYRQAPSIIINGYVRDAQWLIKENYPVWCKGVTPIGCYNKPNENSLDSNILEEWKNKYEGTVAVCDDSGVVIIPKEKLNEEFLKKLDFIELQEDIWEYCISTKKWTTYRTVCQQEYKNLDLIPSEFKNEFEKFINKDNK